MNLDRFVRERQPAWSELEGLVGAAGARPERLGADRVRRLGALYREVVADLAFARARFPRDPVAAVLEDLAGRARHVVYDTVPRRQSALGFLADDYWRRVRERPAALAVAALLLFVPAALATGWALSDPPAAAGVVPAPFRGVEEPGPGRGGGLSPGAGAAFSSAIFTNNIKVSFLAFAGGMTAGAVTAALLVFNGVLLGAVGGLAAGSGGGVRFVELVAPHGVLELSCIVVAGTAGLRLGWAMIDPGRRRRGEAVVAEARAAGEMALGTVPWLVLAGLVEGFLTPARLPLPAAVATGVGLGGLYWALVAGRGGRPPAQSRPRAFVRR